MIKKLNDIKKFYKTLGSNTRLMIRISVISVTVLIIMAIYSYTATYNENYYELLKIADDLLECTKSVAVTGFMGVLMCSYLENK